MAIEGAARHRDFRLLKEGLLPALKILPPRKRRTPFAAGRTAVTQRRGSTADPICIQWDSEQWRNHLKTRYAPSALKVAALIPAYQAQDSVPDVIRAIQAQADSQGMTLPVWLVDDGSTDDTATVSNVAGAKVIRHATNRGKGAALLTGLRALALEGFAAAVTVDADGQHPAEEALRLACHPAPAETLVLGVRDLVRDGAPRSSRFSNSISNRFLSLFSGQALRDTQCGLRRYPLPQILDLAPRSPGYAFEAEVILRAARAGVEIIETPIRVWYPPPSRRVSHFHSVKDPTRIVFRVLSTWLERGAS
jgi:hypothetical protein